MLLTILPPPTSTLFPYTTLFRSVKAIQQADKGLHDASAAIGVVQEPDLVNDSRLPIVKHDDLVALQDRKSTRLNSSHLGISYAVFCLKKKKTNKESKNKMNQK